LTLLAVSCTSPTNCVAVGQSYADFKPLALHYDGTSWQSKPAQSLSGGDTSANGVMCVTSTNCTMVGDGWAGADTTMMQRWNGLVWSFVPPAAPGSQSSLSGISCKTTTYCMAVGQYVTYTGTTPTGLLVNGSSTMVKPAKLPSGVSWAEFNDVSCPAVNVCIAVGTALDAGLFQPLIERWNGSAWSILASPRPGSRSNYLFGVSCISGTDCTAVGTTEAFVPGTGYVAKPLIVRFDGATWKLVNTTLPPGQHEQVLMNVSCVTASMCKAVGYADSGALTERWNGSTWSVESNPVAGASDRSMLLGVSCVSVSRCVAVGQASAGGTQKPVAAVWNGASWASSSPVWNGTTWTNLSSVSCVSATSCFAVGGTTLSNGVGVTFAQRWNGSTWSVMSSQSRPGATNAWLSDVSCAAATNCWAAGGDTSTPFAYIDLEHYVA
jgi:hypothetical protein